MQSQGNVDRPLDMNEMSLREHLLAAQAAEAVGHAHIQHQVHPVHAPLQPSQPLEVHQHQLEPGVPEPYPMEVMDLEDEQDTSFDGKKGSRRELSNSKRAAQNRGAQRAFRQRKEGHIKKLEDQIRTYSVMEASYKHIQAENYELRAYILQLQSRLHETEGSYPQPPSTFSMDTHSANTAPSPPQRANLHADMLIQQPSERLMVPTAAMNMISPMLTSQPPQQLQQQTQEEGYPPSQSPQALPQLQRHHQQFGPLESRVTHMDPSAVAQLKAAAAAAQAPAADEPEMKFSDGTDADEQTYTIEAARAAAYAASKPQADSPDVRSTAHLSQPHTEPS